MTDDVFFGLDAFDCLDGFVDAVGTDGDDGSGSASVEVVDPVLDSPGVESPADEEGLVAESPAPPGDADPEADPELEDDSDPDDPESEESAQAGTDPIADPTPSAIANAPTRPTCFA